MSVKLVGRIRDADRNEIEFTQTDSTTAQCPLAKVNAELRATAEERRHFTNMVVHDLRHPLTSVRVLLYLARQENSPAVRGDLLDTIERRLDVFSGLLSELGECHKIEAGYTSLAIQSVDVASLVADCIAVFDPAQSETTCTIESDISSGLSAISTDEAKLRHILLNLIANALKFTAAGKITVTCQRESNEYWSLQVKDTGCGMIAEHSTRACDEYFQCDPSNRDHDGTGLGLAIVKRLTTALHGRMELESAVGSGTSIRILFPFDKPASRLPR